MLAEAPMSKVHWKSTPLRPMSDEEFELWKALIEERVGITVDAARRSFFLTSLGLRMREIGLDDFGEYYARLQSAGWASEPEWSVLVDRLTVQETSFLRHQPSFDCVTEHLRELLRQPGLRQIQLWSVGCATGEEAYSLAMLTDELVLASGRRISWGVTASDVSRPALTRARQGIYGTRRLRALPPSWQQDYVDTLDEERGQIKAPLRDRLCFVQINVLDLKAVPLQDMDVIFCQNLLIYFRRFRKRDIVHQLIRRLAPGGLLVLGVNEMLDWRHDDVERVENRGVLAYRRRLAHP